MAKTEKNVTKGQVLRAIKELIKAEDAIMVDGVQVTGVDIIKYCNTTLDQIANKADKAREANAKKKVEGDAITAAILSALTDKPQTADQIIAAVGNDELTKNKVASRLATPVKDGIVIKEVVKENKTQKTTYRLAEVSANDEDAE